MTKVEIDQLHIKKITTDQRGRAYLGSEYQDSVVSIAILHSKKKDEDKQ